MSRVDFYKSYVGEKKKCNKGSSHRDGLSTGFGKLGGGGFDVCFVQ